MLLYECKVLLICFFPTDEWTLVLEYCKSEPEFFLCVILCVYLLLYASLRWMHLTVAQILYTIISYLYRIYLLLKCLLTCFNWIQHSVWQLWLLQPPDCRSQIQLILKHTLACTCIALFLGSLLSPHSTVGSTDCGHSGLNCTPQRASASRYIVAFISDSRAESKGGVVYSHVVPPPLKCDACSGNVQDHAHLGTCVVYRAHC